MKSQTLYSSGRLRRTVAGGACGAALLGASVAPAAAASTAPAFFAQAATAQRSTAYSPDQIATAYDFAQLYARGLDGTGQKVALIETGGVNSGDLNQFDAANGLPAAHIAQHYVGGQSFSIGYDPEATLDVEWVHALAPRATIALFYINGKQSVKAGWASMGQAVRSAASRGIGTISISLGACSAGSGYQAMSSALSAVAAQGVSVFVASGDDGAHPGPVRQCGNTLGVSYPGSDPSVVAVGGTSLQLNVNNTIASEIAWNLSGGGVAANLMRPVWQTAPSIPAGTKRWVPDVSFVADPATGVRMVYHGRWQVAGGTSLGAPAWAAAWALIRQDAQNAGKTLGPAENLIYRVGNSSAYATAFHDIQSGSNGQYNAGSGWDPVTGWGTPDVSGLDSVLMAQTP